MKIGQNKWNTHKILNVSRCISDNLLVVYTFNRTMTPYGLKVVIRRIAGGVGVGGCNTPAMILDAPIKNLHNTKDKQADQPLKKCVTPYSIHMLPLLNCHGWKQLIVKNVHIYMWCVVQCYRAHCAIKVLIFLSWWRHKALFMLMHT